MEIYDLTKRANQYLINMDIIADIEAGMYVACAMGNYTIDADYR